MLLETKLHLSRVTLSLLVLTAGIFLLSIMVLVLCVGMQINPFRETTTGLLIAGFFGLIGLAAICVLLNVAVNISLIADAKIAKMAPAATPRLPRRWLAGFAGLAAVLAVIIGGSAYYSKEKYLAVVRAQADEIVQANNAMIDDIAAKLKSGTPADHADIISKIKFLSSQRRDLPDLSLIYAGQFEGRTAYYELTEYSHENSAERGYKPRYYACSQDIDCTYLQSFFSGNAVEPLQKYTLKNDQFYIYLPYNKAETKFILLFNRRNSYGKLGS